MWIDKSQYAYPRDAWMLADGYTTRAQPTYRGGSVYKSRNLTAVNVCTSKLHIRRRHPTLRTFASVQANWWQLYIGPRKVHLLSQLLWTIEVHLQCLIVHMRNNQAIHGEKKCIWALINCSATSLFMAPRLFRWLGLPSEPAYIATFGVFNWVWCRRKIVGKRQSRVNILNITGRLTNRMSSLCLWWHMISDLVPI
jgi:hypothetical protein